MPFLQDVIHKFEVGGGTRYVRWGLSALLLLILFGGYNLRAYRNMGTQEAMDSAQLARNIAQGKGYSTLFVRPLSIFLVKKNNQDATGKVSAAKATDPAQLKGDHPDLANPPVYPVILAGLMKVLPFDFTNSMSKLAWIKASVFVPDLVIALFNQLLFLGLVVMVFFLARRLFDSAVAWTSALVLLGTELIWRFTVSGLSTIVLMIILTGLIWLLMLVEQEAREPKRGRYWPLVLGVLIGLTVGVGGLTRYSFAWLIIPVLFFLVLFAGNQKVLVTFVALLAFAAVTGPWMARNYAVSGVPFGTASYALLENSSYFPGHRLERSLEPDLTGYYYQGFRFIWAKLFTNLRPIVLTELLKISGSWITAFFFVGLMVGFQNPSTKRIRYFILACIPILVLVQALGRTQLSVDAPEVNSENLLVLLVPLMVVYGVALFYVLLDQMALQMLEFRYLVIGLFGLICWIPMIVILFPPKISTLAYPPYDPAYIQIAGRFLKPGEFAMSDVPWAMAWYGQRQCVWLTRRVSPDPNDPNLHEDFLAIHDYLKPINELYLTPATIDRRFLSEWFQSAEQSWGGFILDILVQKSVPKYFPLRNPLTIYESDPKYTRTPEIRRLEAILNRQIELVSQTADAMLADPKLSEAIKDSKLADNFMLLAKGRDFPLGNVPVGSERDLELLILRGQLILTDWNRVRTPH